MNIGDHTLFIRVFAYIHSPRDKGLDSFCSIRKSGNGAMSILIY